MNTTIEILSLKPRKLLSDEQLISNFLQYVESTTKYGGKSMYQYSFSKDKEKEILDSIEKSSNSSNSSSEKSLEDKLKEVDEKYNLNTTNKPVDSSLDLKKLDEIVIDEKSIKSEAETSAAKEKEDKVLQLEEDVKNKTTALENSKQDKIDSADSSKSYIEKLYAERKEDASNEALKRGLARSSIIINQIEAFDKEKINEYIALDKQLTSAIGAITSEIDNLSAEKETALKNYDIAYAVSVEDKIKSLTNELTKKQQDVIKYNNEIAETEAKYKDGLTEKNNDVINKNLKNAMDIAEFVQKNGVAALDNLKNSEKLNLVLGYLNDLSKEEALKQIDSNKNFYKEQLGDRYYDLITSVNKR